MSRSRKRRQAEPEENEEEIEAFLAASAAENRRKKEEEEKKRQIPEEVFKDLPEPPSKTYPERNFPVRELHEYNEYTGYRDREHEEKVRELEEALPDCREGGMIHEQVRDWAMNYGIIKPGVKLYDMCSEIEEAVRRQVLFKPPERGLAFPCGCSLNRCAAHYSPLPGDETILKESDVMKIDFGVCVNGMVTDSAFTVCFDDRFKPLIDASREATNRGVRMAGPDARLSEIASEIDEVIRSHQLELDGKIYAIRPVENLGGHEMRRYTIHAGKFLPIAKPRQGREIPDRMEVGELYALETFATTGSGIVEDVAGTSHFMLAPGYHHGRVKKGPLSDLADFLEKNYKTLAFAQRFLERQGQHQYKHYLDQLIKQKVVNPYPPLSDVEGSWVSQHEHCFAILPKGKEIFSRLCE